MINTLRADFYRLLHTRGFWLTQAALVVIIVGSVLSQSAISFMVNDVQTTPQLNETLPWTGPVALEGINSMMSVLLYLLWPLLVITMGQDFSKLTYKNNLTVGVSRSAYFFAKYLTMTTIAALQLLYLYVVSFVTGTLLNGLGELPPHYFLDVSRYYLLHLLLLSAIMSFAIFMLYLTGNLIATVLTGVLTPVILAVLPLSRPKVEWLQYFDFQGIADNLMTVGLESLPLPAIILAATATILLMVSASLLVFNRREL